MEVKFTHPLPISFALSDQTEIIKMKERASVKLMSNKSTGEMRLGVDFNTSD